MISLEIEGLNEWSFEHTNARTSSRVHPIASSSTTTLTGSLTSSVKHHSSAYQSLVAMEPTCPIITMEESQEDHAESQTLAQETPAEDVFIAPSIHENSILSGESYTHHCAIPQSIAEDMSIECVLGVDEAGRGPVLGIYHRPVYQYDRGSDRAW